MDDTAKNLAEVSDVTEAFKQFEHFCKAMLDGWVVVDTEGRVVKCNQFFANLSGSKTKSILKANSLGEIITFELAGKPLGIKEMVQSPAPTRYDEVIGNISSKPDQPLHVIIGLYPFSHNGTNIGAFILVRDVTAEASLQGKYKDKATQSITDALTGLFNRNYFTEYLESQVKTLESFPVGAPQKQLSVIMMDIDFFKKINDKFGHQAGDHVLKHTSDLMKSCFRKTDVVARYGGEEFLAILPGTDFGGAAVAADKLRSAVESYVFNFEGTIIPVTISIGVAQIDFGKETGEQSIARADAALYQSKHNGRNQVSIHNGEAVIPFKMKQTAA
jgi:diguanylate cyclase (GGDEF)-like protein